MADRHFHHGDNGSRLCRGSEPASPLLSRRDLLGRFSTGFAGVALASMLADEGLLAQDARTAALHHAPKARRVVHIFLQGGLSQIDSFDYKPTLYRYHDKAMPASEQPDVFFGQVGHLHRPHWDFKRYGESGLWVSDLFPHMAQVADLLTPIHSMVSSTGNHTPATFQAHTGFRVLGFPAMGAWLGYGLGSENRNLPTFVVMPDARGLPTGGANNWGSGFLPAQHQGVVFRTQGPAVHDLHPSADISDERQRAQHQALLQLNQQHEAARENDALTARIRSYEMAARMQMAVPEVTSLDGESEKTREMYGLDQGDTRDFGRAALIARRMLERGVRCVQLWSGANFGGPTWDAHGDVPSNHANEATRIDQPVAALLKDLQQRGMLEETLVVISTEFGRTPFAQSASGTAGKGRDHNQTAFTNILAGAGVKPGMTFGETDEFGYRSVRDPVNVHDFHATILHLMGIDHERLTFYHNGFERRLTDVHGHVVRPILA